MRLAPRIPKNLPPKVEKIREGDSQPHIDMLALLPDAITGAYDGVHGHHPMHLVDNLPKGMGRRHLDRYAVPLGEKTHIQGVHKRGDEQAYFESVNFDWRKLSTALWACRGRDLAEYEYVMSKHLMARGIYIEFRPSPVMKRTRYV